MKQSSLDLNLSTKKTRKQELLAKNRDRPRLISPNMVLQPKLVSLSLNRLG